MHHGIDREYVDRNYGGVLIVWDRLFGTFCAERHEPRYGTLAPFDSASVASANLVEWSRMLNVARETRRLRDKLWVFVAPPEWRPSDVRVATASRARPRDVPADVALVVSLQIVIVAIAAGLALAPELGVRAGLLVEDPSGVALAVLVAWLSLVAIGWGALLDRRAWSPALALALAALTPVIAFVAGASAPMLAAACVAGAASALAVHRVAASRVERHSIATRRASA